MECQQKKLYTIIFLPIGILMCNREPDNLISYKIYCENNNQKAGELKKNSVSVDKKYS